MRVDRAVGRALANYFSANSKSRYSVDDFSPFDSQHDKAGSIDDVFSIISNAAKENNG